MAYKALRDLAPITPVTSSPAPLWHHWCTLNTPVTAPPPGLCSSCSLCLKGSSPRNLLPWSPHLRLHSHEAYSPIQQNLTPQHDTTLLCAWTPFLTLHIALATFPTHLTIYLFIFYSYLFCCLALTFKSNFMRASLCAMCTGDSQASREMPGTYQPCISL